MTLNELLAYRNPKFANKAPELQELFVEAALLLSKLGIPVAMTGRRLECMAMAFLAILEVTERGDWKNARDFENARKMKTRDIIEFWNSYFEENLSRGSYDDVRRKHLRPLTLAGIVVSTAPDAATNAPNRGYALNQEYSTIVRTYGSDGWDEHLAQFMAARETLSEKLYGARPLDQIPVTLPEGTVIQFGLGEHNELQKAVIEEYLPRYGYGARVLYVGDASNRHLLQDEATLRELNFFDLTDRELPDIIAYSQEKNWLYLIEVVHSSGPLSPERMLRLKRLTAACKVGIIFVTAFRDKATFRKFVTEIAWETDVWIAQDPDHLVHFDGERFLGPYPSP